jgi:hypothetical protein
MLDDDVWNSIVENPRMLLCDDCTRKHLGRPLLVGDLGGGVHGHEDWFEPGADEQTEVDTYAGMLERRVRIERQLDDPARAAKAEEVFLALLRRFTAQNQRVHPDVRDGYAPSKFAAHPDAQGLTSRAFSRAMGRLLMAGKIKICTEGPRGDRWRFLALADDA